MHFETQEFDSLQEFLKWYDVMERQVWITETFNGNPFVVRYALLPCQEFDLTNSEPVC